MNEHCLTAKASKLTGVLVTFTVATDAVTCLTYRSHPTLICKSTTSGAR